MNGLWGFLVGCAEVVGIGVCLVLATGVVVAFVILALIARDVLADLGSDDEPSDFDIAADQAVYVTNLDDDLRLWSDELVGLDGSDET